MTIFLKSTNAFFSLSECIVKNLHKCGYSVPFWINVHHSTNFKTTFNINKLCMHFLHIIISQYAILHENRCSVFSA
jgi:hypothetical protein